MRQASLYYHFPDGKEQLYKEMAGRVLRVHSVGMASVIARAGEDLRSQLHAVASWFAQNRPVNVMGMMYADLPALSRRAAQELAQTAYEALFFPLTDIFTRRAGTRQSAQGQPGDTGRLLPGTDGRHHL